MPASIEDGGPIVLCPVGMPTDFGATDQPHHHDGDQGSKHSVIAWENCPFGAFLETATLAPEISIAIFHLTTNVAPTIKATVIVFPKIAAFRVRAPPVLDKHV